MENAVLLSTLSCLCVTFLKAQLDFRGWKGRGGAAASGAALAQATSKVFIVCSGARADLPFIYFQFGRIWSFRANSTVRLGEPKAGH
mgnify:CR=1 FL=1